jgi:hypothetical protein
MTNSGLNENEKEILEWFIKETGISLRRFRIKIRGFAVVLFVIIASMTFYLWTIDNATHISSILIGGLFYAVFGAVLTVVGSLSKPSTLAQMSMTKIGGNPNLFYELMKSREKTFIGLSLIGLGFLMQALGMLLNETIGL